MENGMNMAHFYFFFLHVDFPWFTCWRWWLSIVQATTSATQRLSAHAERQELLLSAGGSGNGGRDPTKFRSNMI